MLDRGVNPRNGNNDVNILIGPLVVPYTILLCVPESAVAGLDSGSVVCNFYKSRVDEKLVALGVFLESLNDFGDDLAVPFRGGVVAVCFVSNDR